MLVLAVMVHMLMCAPMGSDPSPGARRTALTMSTAVRSTARMVWRGMGSPPFRAGRTNSIMAKVQRNVKRTAMGRGYPDGVDELGRQASHAMPAALVPVVLPWAEAPRDVCRDADVSGTTSYASQSTTARRGTKVVGWPTR